MTYDIYIDRQKERDIHKLDFVRRVFWGWGIIIEKNKPKFFRNLPSERLQQVATYFMQWKLSNSIAAK